MDYTYHNQLTLNSVLGNFPESYALDTHYDPAGRIVRRRLGTPGTIVTQYSYNPWNVQGGRWYSTIGRNRCDARSNVRRT